MNSGNERDRGAVVERRAVVERLRALRAQDDDVQRLIDAVREQQAVVREERLGVTAEYRLLANNASPEDWARQALEQEHALLREEGALGREWLRLIGEQRRLRQERLALLAEQAILFNVSRPSRIW